MTTTAIIAIIATFVFAVAFVVFFVLWRKLSKAAKGNDDNVDENPVLTDDENTDNSNDSNDSNDSSDSNNSDNADNAHVCAEAGATAKAVTAQETADKAQKAAGAAQETADKALETADEAIEGLGMVEAQLEEDAYQKKLAANAPRINELGDALADADVKLAQLKRTARTKLSKIKGAESDVAKANGILDKAKEKARLAKGDLDDARTARDNLYDAANLDSTYGNVGDDIEAQKVAANDAVATADQKHQDALKGVKKAEDALAGCKTEVEKLSKELDDTRKAIDDLQKDIDAMETELNGLISRN